MAASDRQSDEQSDKQPNIRWEYDDRVGQWINPKTGEVRPESYSQEETTEEVTEEVAEESNEMNDGVSAGREENRGEEETDSEEPEKPAFQLSREQIGQGMRWTRNEETGEPLPCPNCGRGLVEVPRESKLFHVCCSLLESEYPSCDYFQKVVKESSKPEYPKSGTGKKGKKVAVIALSGADD